MSEGRTMPEQLSRATLGAKAEMLNPENISCTVLTSPNKSKLYWRCRRGMLELDLLLQTFLEREYDGLSNEERLVFQGILEYQDQMLLGYLLGRSVPIDGAVACVVNKIRSTSHD